jgi:serine/threonine-protein kinase
MDMNRYLVTYRRQWGNPPYNTAVTAATLGRYRLVTRIAQGGMGEVFRGVDVGWGGVERPVAIKVMAPQFAREPELVRSFLDECKLSFLLCHNNVVQVRDIGQAGEDTCYIAMEWVDGGDLGHILSRLRERAGQPLPMRFAVLVAVEAARGLDYAHRLRDAQGRALHVVHRDISPSNLLVSFEGEVKVSDFGIARSRLKQVQSLPGELKGKMGYLAPEQARGDDVDLRVDVFALGVVLYEMVTGQNPFTHGATEREALMRVQKGEYRPPRLVAPSLSQGLEAIILRAMAPDRQARYASCGAMREDLEAFARREGYTLSPSDFGQFVRELMVESSPTQETPAMTVQARRPSGSRRAEPKPFDLALGEGLAQLSSPAGGMPALGSEPAVTSPGKRTAVALHEVVTPPPAATVEGEAPGESTDRVPRNYPSALIWIALGAVGLGLAGISLAVTLSHRAGIGAAEVLPPVVATPPENATANANPNANANANTNEHRPAHSAPRPPRAAPQPAKLSIASDGPANVYVDGEFVHTAPVDELPVPAGTHVVRVESSASGLRLIPKEETVTLRAGESRRLTMELK